MMPNETVKKIYRLPPCPSYDMEGMACWLEDMAAKGYVLEHDGFFMSVASFEKQDPQKLRYRFEAAPHQTGLWSGHDTPDEDAVALNREFGWEYVATHDQFYIYVSVDENAEELNTDPQIQALSLQKIRKRERGALFNNIWWIVFNIVLFFKGALVRSILLEGSWFALYTFLMLLWLTADSVIRAVHLRKLYKMLKNDTMPNYRKSWKEKAVWHRLRPILQVCMILGWVIWLLCNWSSAIMEKDTISIFDYPDEPPFATVADYAPGGTYTSEKMSFSNKVTVNADPLAPRLLEWSEHADIKTTDGRTLELSVYIDYFETAHPLLAKALVWEYERQDSKHKDYAPLSLTVPHTLDYAAVYTGDLHMPTMLLRKGNAVGRFQFISFGDDKLTLDEWAQITISVFNAMN